jgi:hypothetical protein
METVEVAGVRHISGTRQLATDLRERITVILALAGELKGGTIEAVLAKSDAELGLEFLLGKRTP